MTPYHSAVKELFFPSKRRSMKERKKGGEEERKRGRRTTRTTRLSSSGLCTFQKTTLHNNLSGGDGRRDISRGGRKDERQQPRREIKGPEVNR